MLPRAAALLVLAVHFLLREAPAAPRYARRAAWSQTTAIRQLVEPC